MELIKASLMAAAMQGGGGGSATLGSAEFTANGVYTPQSVHAAVDGWNQVTVNVPTGGNTDPIFEYILQHIQYLDGQFVVGQYTYKIGWLWADSNLFGKDNTAASRSSSSPIRQAIIVGDGVSSYVGRVGWEYYQTPLSTKKYLYYFNVLFKSGTAKAVWLHTTMYQATEGYTWGVQSLYTDAKGDYYFLENAQRVTRAEYLAALYSSTPHTEEGRYYSYKDREYVLVSHTGSFTYDTTSFTITDIYNYCSIPISFTYSYEIDYNTYWGYPAADSSSEEVASWGADWVALMQEYPSKWYYAVQTYPPRPVITNTGIQSSANNQTSSSRMTLIPPNTYYGVVSAEELSIICNEVLDGVIAMMTTSDDIDKLLVTPPYVPSPTP